MTYVIYSKTGCVYCDKVKALLESRGIAYLEHKDPAPDVVEKLKQSGHKTYPFVFSLLGGFTETEAFLNDF